MKRPHVVTPRTARLDAWCVRNDESVLTVDGLDEALLGVAQIFNICVAVYDRAKCIMILQARGLSESEAEEFFEVNMQGAYMGQQTPAFLVWRIEDLQ